MRLATIALALALCFPARADDWTRADTAWELAFAGAVALDVGQTQWALRNGYREANPLLGSHPDSARLVAFAAGAVAGHALVSALLPRDWRRIWQVVSVSVEAGAVGHNAIAGARFSF